MKIKDALPHVFNRAYPVLDPKMPMLPAVSMLRFQQIDGLPLLIIEVTSGRPRALHGYSLLKRLLAIEPGRLLEIHRAALRGRGADASAPSGADEELEHLFDVFLKERFGFAWISESERTGVPVSLADVLELYNTGTIESDLRSRTSPPPSSHSLA